jgi:hypothetical protein
VLGRLREAQFVRPEMPILRSLAVAITGASLLGLLPVGHSSAAEGEPPACAAIAFRPNLSAAGEGDQDAGLYKSRFGRIEVKATIKSGSVANFYVQINGKALGPVAGALPKSVETCAKAKRFTAPADAEATCTGDRVAVLIDHAGTERYVLLYAHRAGVWRFCSAGLA